MLEAAVVIGQNQIPLYWHLPPTRTSVSLPDSQDLWQFLWNNRDKIIGVAHTHPGSGNPYPSDEDITTFRAIEAALGQDLEWFILSQDRMIVVDVHDTEPLILDLTEYWQEGFPWVPELRHHTYGDPDATK